ncbi:MAG: S8 family serine peptidase, partial [Rhodothermales bacterium]|nr:S8 family serine peptidase [Rhodothermales bacterium]
GIKASFSSFGPTADGRTKPEVAAMGQSVYVASGSAYAFANGTSFSSPLVAAVACQILQANPDLTPMEVRQVLMDTASQSDTPDNSLGYGIVNAGEAVDRALSMIIVGLDDERPATRQDLTIDSSFPNPSTNSATLTIGSITSRTVAIEVYDVAGRIVLSVERQLLHEGQNRFTVSTSELSSGLYLVRVSAPDAVAFKQLAVIN